MFTVLSGLHPVAAGDDQFAGTTIHIGVQNAHAIGNPAKVHAATWEARTGGDWIVPPVT